MRNSLFIISALWTAPFLGAETYYSLFPTNKTKLRAEAVTAVPIGIDSLLYNPAHLVDAGFGVSLLSTEVATDDNTATGIGTVKKSFEKTDDVIEESYRVMRDYKNLNATSTETLFELSFPYMAAFAKSLQRVEYNRIAGGYDFFTYNDTILAYGMGLKWGKLAFGFSQYYLTRILINTVPTNNQYPILKTALSQGGLPRYAETIAKISRLGYGSAFGTNYGLRYKPFKNNESQLGIGVLSQGNAIFTDRFAISNKSAQDAELVMGLTASRYGMVLKRPPAIDEIYNLGVYLTTRGPKSRYSIEGACDVNDVLGHMISYSYACFGGIGYKIADNQSKKSAWLIRRLGFHFGPQEFFGYAGFRYDSYLVYGLRTDWHIGMGKLVSPLKLSTDYYKLIDYEAGRLNVLTGFTVRLDLIWRTL